jgi:hypothetical protein
MITDSLAPIVAASFCKFCHTELVEVQNLQKIERIAGNGFKKNVNNFTLLKLKISYFCSYNGVSSKVSY